MSSSWRVAGDVWLGLAAGEPDPSGLPRNRRLMDQKAAAVAERAALAASGLGASAYSVSRSHTQGMGAAVVVPGVVRLGVDLVLIDQVSERHAAGVLSRTEWMALGPHAAVRPALAWALKEAAAKATGEPLRHFPDGLRIDVTAARGVVVGLVREPRVCFVARWVRFGRLLCAWVREKN